MGEVEPLEEILGTLAAGYKNRELDLPQYLLVTDMLEKITDHVVGHYTQVRKELDTIMGGKILEFKGERLYNKGLKQGEERGEKRGEKRGEIRGEKRGKKEGILTVLAGLVTDGLMPKEEAMKRAVEKYGVSEEEFAAALSSFEKEDERLQG